MSQVCPNINVSYIFSEHFFHMVKNSKRIWKNCPLIMMLIIWNNYHRNAFFLKPYHYSDKSNTICFPACTGNLILVQNSFESLQYLNDAWHLIKCIWQSIKCCIRSQWSYRSLSEILRTLKESLKDNWAFLLCLLPWANLKQSPVIVFIFLNFWKGSKKEAKIPHFTQFPSTCGEVNWKKS